MYIPEFIEALAEHYEQANVDVEQIVDRTDLTAEVVEAIVSGATKQADWDDIEAITEAMDTTIGTVALHYDHDIPDAIFYGLVADETLRNVDVSELDRGGRRFLLRHLRRGEPPHPTLRPLEGGQGNDFVTFFEAIEEPSEILLTEHSGVDYTGVAAFDAFDNLRLSAFVYPALLEPYEVLTKPDRALTPDIYGVAVSEPIFYVMKLGRFWKGEYRRLIKQYARHAGRNELSDLQAWTNDLNEGRPVSVTDWQNDQ